MTILKLPNAGDSATLEITGCEEVKGDYGLQIAFMAREDVLYLPKASADRQLERIGLGFEEASYGEIVGKILTFSRTKNPKPGAKPFWDISLAGSTNENGSAGGEMGKPNVGTFAIGPSADSAKPKMRDAYKDLTKWVMREILPLYAAEFDECGPDLVAACTQTLFIAAHKSGKFD